MVIAKNGTITNRSIGTLTYATIELFAIQDDVVITRLENATLGRNTASGVHVVASHHSYCYSRPLALADGVGNLVTKSA